MAWKKISAFFYLFTLVVLVSLFKPSLIHAGVYSGYEGLTVNEGTRLNGLINAPFPLSCSVDTYNGNIYCDLSFPGNVTGSRGLPIDIVLSYNLTTVDEGMDTPYGFGWQTSYGHFYNIEANGDITITWGDGTKDRFTKSGTSFIPPPGIHVTLEEYAPGKYLITMKRGVNIYFDAPHRKVTSIVDPNNNTLMFTYNTSDLLTTITDPSGKVVSLTYGVDERLDSITDPVGNTWTYGHNTEGDLVTITDPLSNTITLSYDASHRLKTITDSRGISTNIYYASFSGFGTVVRRVENTGTVWSFSYSWSGKTATVTDTQGRQWQYTYDSYTNGRVIKARNPYGNIRQYSWDSNHNLIREIDENGIRTDMGYDSNGNLVSKIEAVGTAVQRTTSYTYSSDGFNNIASVTEAVGTPDERTTVYSYDVKGNLTGQCVDPTGLNLCTTYTYDSYGNRTSMTNPRGIVTNYAYTEIGPNLTPTGNLTQTIFDPGGLAITTFYEYDAVGKTKVTDPEGKVTCNLYDANYRLIQVVRKVGDTTCPTGLLTHPGAPVPYNDDIVTQYTYDTVGNQTSVIDPRGKVSCSQYDGLNRVIKSIAKIGDTDCGVEDGNDLITEYAYDSVGNRTSVKDPEGNTASYSYDSLNRLMGVTDALSNSTTYGYDNVGNRTRVTDARGKVSCTQYDSLNRVTTEIRNIGDTDCGIDGDDIVTTYTYDGRGNRTSVTDPLSNTTTYVYDNANRLIQVIDPISCVTSYEYDDAGNRTKVTDSNGNIDYFEYDAANRLITSIGKNNDTSQIPDSDDAESTYTYDANGNRTSVSVAATVILTMTTTYTYDDVNRLISETNPEGETTTYGYDLAGNRTTVTNPAGNMTTYTYDDVNRITAISDSLGGVASYTYDKNNNRLTEIDANGNTATYTYDGINRLIFITDPLSQTVSFEYDEVGNQIKITDRNGVITETVYDDINRRTSVTEGSGTADERTTTYAYDSNSNLTFITDGHMPGYTTTYTYDSLNRLTDEQYADSTTRGIGYDCKNMTSRTDQNGNTTTYIYDDIDRLVTRDYRGTNDDTFGYDRASRMISSSNSDSAITFSYDDATRLTSTIQNGKAITYTHTMNTAEWSRAIKYPGDTANPTIKEEKDDRGRLSTVTYNPSGTPTTLATYNYTGARLMTKTLGNGTSFSYTYNANNWVAVLQHTGVIGASTTPEYQLALTTKGTSNMRRSYMIPQTQNNTSMTASIVRQNIKEGHSMASIRYRNTRTPTPLPRHHTTMTK